MIFGGRLLLWAVVVSSLLISSVLYLNNWRSGPEITVRLTHTLDSHSGIGQDEPRWLYLYVTTPGSKLPLSYYQSSLRSLPDSVVLHSDMYLLPGHKMQGKLRLQVVAKISVSADPHAFNANDNYLYSDVIYPLWNRKPEIFFRLDDLPRL